MKKFMTFLCSLVLVFSVVRSANAIMFTDVEILNTTLAEGPIAGIVYPDTVEYQHETPEDFEVPWDIVNSATLTISGYWIDDNNDQVAVEGTAVGNLTASGSIWSWDDYWTTPSISNFDITSTFSSWTTGSPLVVTITANGGIPNFTLFLETSTFTLDYENRTTPTPTPEPATMLLMGAGLLGLVGFGRKQINKKG